MVSYFIFHISSVCLCYLICVGSSSSYLLIVFLGVYFQQCYVLFFGPWRKHLWLWTKLWKTSWDTLTYGKSEELQWLQAWDLSKSWKLLFICNSFIFYCISGSGSQGQQPEHGEPNASLPSHYPQLLWGQHQDITKLAKRYNLSSASLVCPRVFSQRRL